MPVLRVYYAQIEGDLLRRGIDPFDYTVRQMLSIAESWFLSHFAPHEWGEVLEKLEGANASEQTTIVDAHGAPLPVSKKAMDEMAELLAAASGPPPEPEPAGAESGDPS